MIKNSGFGLLVVWRVGWGDVRSVLIASVLAEVLIPFSDQYDAIDHDLIRRIFCRAE